MALENITLGAFAICNSMRILAYFPQIRAAATDNNGASAISCTTWMLFLVANLSTVAYALVNRSDWWLAGYFAANALCCLAIVAVTFWRRRRHAALAAAPPTAPRRLGSADCEPVPMSEAR
jgi:hypothetical protein